MPATFETERLVLVPATIAMLRADIAGTDALAQALNVAVTPEWPPELYDADAINWTINMIQNDPRVEEWGLRYFVLKGAAPTLIGVGGYKGAPKDGGIELGYSVLPAYQRRGYASEATNGMVARAFEASDVTRVFAHTLPHLTPSIRVLEKCGFRFDGDGEESGTVRFVISRDDVRR